MNFPGFRLVIDEWSSIATRPAIHDPTGGCSEENPTLASLLQSDEITLYDIGTLPMDFFNIGDGGSDMIWLTDEEFVWLLPVFLVIGYVSGESQNVINELRQRLLRSQEWPIMKKRLSPQALEWLNDVAQECCEFGWQDARRIQIRKDACRELLT